MTAGDLTRTARAQLNPAAVPANRKKIAVAIGLLADALQGGLFAGMPAFSWVPADGLDLVVAAVLVALLGFRWRLVFALGLELVPGAQLFPSWTAFLLSLPTVEAETRKLAAREEAKALGPGDAR